MPARPLARATPRPGPATPFARPQTRAGGPSLPPTLPALALLLALGLSAWPALPARADGAALQAHRPGEEMLLDDCLRLSALSFTDRNGPLDTADWVTLRLSNGCTEPVRSVRVELLLQDVLGHVYGARLWLLEQGEVLLPGASKTERYAVADDADHIPARWGARLRAVERPSDRLRRPRAGSSPNRATAAPSTSGGKDTPPAQP